MCAIVLLYSGSPLISLAMLLHPFTSLFFPCIFNFHSLAHFNRIHLMCMHLEIRKTKFICFVHLIFTNNHAISFETDDIFYNYFAVSRR